MLTAILKYSMDKFNLLVIDDDEGIRDAVSEYLMCQGFNVSIAYTPNEIVETIRKNNIHLLLMDINLSGYDGRYVCKALKEHYNIDIPVILFSASNQYNLGNTEAFLADYFVEKPFEGLKLKFAILHQLDMNVQPFW